MKLTILNSTNTDKGLLFESRTVKEAWETIPKFLKGRKFSIENDQVIVRV